MHCRVAITLAVVALLAAPNVSAKCITDIAVFDPHDIEIPSELNKYGVERAVMTGLVMRGWEIGEVASDKGYIDAELPIREHIARVRIDKTGAAVTFHYRESDNLPHGWKAKNTSNYSSCTEILDKRPSETAEELVHPNYKVWINDLGRTIKGTLRIEALKPR